MNGQRLLTCGQMTLNKMCGLLSALDIGFQWLESVFPGFSVYLFSGESSFHNKEFKILSI